METKKRTFMGKQNSQIFASHIFEELIKYLSPKLW